ncbi:MAG TPA: hypothetical protein VGI45_28985 [Terracidiphilus sp.]|jgi:hypothetical protein
MATSTITSSASSECWNIVLIEDNQDLVRQMEEFFARKVIAGRRLRILPETDWDNAFRAIKERKADLFILDIYKGPARLGGERIGESVLAEIRSNGFVAVVLHTNLPEGLDELTNEFIRLIPKTSGLTALAAEIEALFETKIPQMHRAITHHLDRALRDYMWEFVVQNWKSLSEIAGKPEFLRVLIQRLAISFSASGIDTVVSEVFPDVNEHRVAEDKVHPAEVYVKPPIGIDPVLGDVRLKMVGTDPEYWIVLWPTCDMVSTGGRVPKTSKALCVRAGLLSAFKECQDYTNSESGGTRKRLMALLKNERDVTPDRYHFLPGLCDVPDLVADFQDLDHIPLIDVKGWRCVASLRSPHAESLSVRFERYRNRIGTPDLDNEIVMKRLKLLVVESATEAVLPAVPAGGAEETIKPVAGSPE